MRKILIAVVLLSFVVGLGDTLYACGSKFLVGSTSNPKYARILASIEPTSILVYWRQDADTPDEDRWSPSAEELLATAGHTVTVAIDHEEFLRSANGGNFDVVMMLIEEAREVKDEVSSLLPDSALLPISHNTTRRQLREAKKEFGNVLRTPSTIKDFLLEIEESRDSNE